MKSMKPDTESLVRMQVLDSLMKFLDDHSMKKFKPKEVS